MIGRANFSGTLVGRVCDRLMASPITGMECDK
jgi:hypothetical protein